MTSEIDLSFLRSPAAWKRIAAITVGFAVAGAIWSLLLPKWYRSVLTVIPTKSQKTSISSLLGGDGSGLAAGFEGLTSSGADIGRITAVLQSVAVADAVVDKFDLQTRYDQKYPEAARETLWRHCGVKPLPKPNLVQVSCEDVDPAFAQKLVAFFAEYGNVVFRRVGASSASEEVRFLEKRVTELRQQADQSSKRMREFQEKHRIIDLETQSKALVSALAALNTQRISKQLERDYARAFAAQDEATLRQLGSQIGVIDERLKDLEGSTDASVPATVPGTAEKKGMFPAALAVPQLRAEYETLYRDRKVAEATLVFALERLEAAKATEARDVSTFLVLDPPTLPHLKSRPTRSVIVALAMLAGALLAIVYEWARSQGGPRAAVRRLLRSAPAASSSAALNAVSGTK